MSDYNRFYRELTFFFRCHHWATSFLVLVNRTITLFMYICYPCFLLHLYWESKNRELPLLPYLIYPGSGFVLVSLLRHYLNQPRPYEVWNISPLLPKETKGQSMPSRHVFSATMIAMTIFSVYRVFGGILLVMSVLLAVVRVLGGVHYPKDVLVGFICAIIWGLFLL